MNTTNTTRKATTVRLPDYMLADLHAEARRQGISVSRLIESMAEEKMYRPNEKTIEAINESRSGKFAGTVDTSSMESFKKSMGL